MGRGRWIGLGLSGCALLSACEVSSGDNTHQSAELEDGGVSTNDTAARDVGSPDVDLYGGTIYAISRTHRTDAGMRSSYSATAGFAEVPAEVCTDRTPVNAGACRLLDCAPRTPDAPDGGLRPTAGQIEISGGIDRVFLWPRGGGQYNPWISPGRALFNGGEQLTATAPGDVVPQFQLSVVAPARPVLTTPKIPTEVDAKLVIDRSTPFMIAWTGGAGGILEATINVLQIDQRLEVSCRFQAAAGQGAIAREVLAQLPAGEAVYELRAENTSTTAAGQYTVRLTAASNVVDSDQVWARGEALLR